MHAFKGFSATGTGLYHKLKIKKGVRLPFGSLTRKNINYLNNIALGIMPASKEESSTPSSV